MSHSSAPQHITLTAPLARVMQLHGAPFINLLTNTSFGPGEPPAGVAANLNVPPTIADMIARIIALQHADSSAEDYQERGRLRNLIENEFESIVRNEAMLLSDEAFSIFDRHLAIELLNSVHDAFESLPAFNSIIHSPNRGIILKEMSVQIRQQLTLLGFLQCFSRVTDGRGEVGKIMAENFFHDALGHFCYIRDHFVWAARYPEKLSMLEEAQGLRNAFSTRRDFVLQIAKGNIAIASDNFPIAPFNPATNLISPVKTIASRFEMKLSINNLLAIQQNEFGHINFVCSDQAVCYGTPAALTMVIYNLVKNSLKQASNRKELPSVTISVEPSSDGNCTSIFVRDSGLGFSYDQLRTKFTTEAIAKLRGNLPLSFIEECLIDEAWVDHVPFAAIGQLLCNRGATTGNGTGIGLHLAKHIIESGHQGAIRLYNHPTMGAGVQILLPNMDGSFSTQVRRQITINSLQHQLENGLPIS